MSTLIGQNAINTTKLSIAALVSRTHLLLLGDAGGGKTSIVDGVIKELAAQGIGGKMFRLEASTPKEEVGEIFDIKHYQEFGEYATTVKGSTLDPEYKVVGGDELPRSNDPVYDVFMKSTDRWDLPPNEQPVFIITGNFIDRSIRLTPLWDRVSYVYIYIRDVWDYDSIKAQALVHLTNLGERPRLPIPIPSKDAIEDVLNYTASDATNEMIADAISRLGMAGLTAGFEINRRRISQWSRIMYRTSALYWEKPDFDSLHPETIFVMKYAQIVVEASESRRWAEVVRAIENPLDVLVEQAYEASKEELYKAYNNASDESDKIAAVNKALMTQLARVQSTMVDMNIDFSSEPRYAELEKKLKKILVDIVMKSSNK